MPRRTRIAALLAVLLAATVPGQAPAQDRLAPYGVSPSVPAPSGGTTYLPYGTVGGGFVPYTSGAGGGLGVMTRPRSAAIGPAFGMGAMRSAAAAPAPRGRAALTPLTPLGRLGSRAMRGPAMSAPRMGRPPVGGYPFRPPTNLLGPATSAPAMSM